MSLANELGYNREKAMLEHAAYPNMFNIEEDPSEERPVIDTSAWAVGPYLLVVAEYQKTSEEDPDPPAFSRTEFQE